MRARPKKPIPSHCSGRPTASDKNRGQSPISFFLGNRALSPIFLLLSGCAQLAPLPGAEFAFGILGDTPYSRSEAEKLDALIGRINQQELAFVVHVGDIGTSSATQGCSDAWIEARKRQFARIRHPFVLIPGDNEWSDCRDPQGRLAQWRKLFCAEVPALALERQAGGHCENIRWQAGGMMFVGLNVPGRSANPLGERDMQPAFEWLDESLALAHARRAQKIFVFLHADPYFERNEPDDGYARLRAVLAAQAGRFAGRLVLVHGDTHIHRDDEPLPGLRRIEVWGSPFVAWLRASVARGALRVEAGW